MASRITATKTITQIGILPDPVKIADTSTWTGLIAGALVIGVIIVIEPDRSSKRPRPVETRVEHVGIRPSPHREPRGLLIGHHGPVTKGQGRTFLQEPGVPGPPAFIPMDETVQCAVAPPGLFLELGDRELRPAVLDNDIDEVRLFPGELGLLPSRGPI